MRGVCRVCARPRTHPPKQQSCWGLRGCATLAKVPPVDLANLPLPIPCDDSPFTGRFAPFVGNLFGYCLPANILE